jgi:Homeodomain
VMSKSPHNLYDFLFNFYQMNEYKKNNLQKNYDFLLKYYQMCEKDQTQIMASDKINLDFLLQYYQMNESKKTFQQQSELSLPKNVGGASSNVNSNTTITSISGINGGESMNDGLAAGCIVSGSMSSASSQSSLNSTPIGLSGGSALELMDSRDHHIGSYVGPSSTSSHSNVMSAVDKQANKRLRTTILPEQLNFLYECYQTESNPSRKMLEEISKKVNLKKRVVQVNSNE